MTYADIMRTAFSDELIKISAVRMGRKPYMAQTLANATKFVKKGVMTKISGKGSSIKPLLVAGGIGAAGGAFGMHQTKKAVDDYRTGKALRRAQEQGQVG
jgi:hypothetical protein